MSEWKPPSGNSVSDYDFYDWQSLRNTIQTVKAVLNDPVEGSIDRKDWNFAGLCIDHFKHTSRRTCVECETLIPFQREIVCYDCEAPLCRNCAPRHFWPNGRPK